MIDLHSHLIPGIDDGARTLDDALALLKMAQADGITHTVLTPHIHPGRWENDKAIIKQNLHSLSSAAQAEGLTIKLGMAGEVRISAEILTMVATDQIPFLGQWQGANVMLLEMPHSHIMPGSDKLIQWLQKRNIIPMIAHPERNKDIMRDIKKIQPLVKQGCLFQVTAGSVVGKFGEVSQQIAWQLLEQGLVTVIATDAHNVKHRMPVLSEAKAAISNKLGENKAAQLFFENPWAIAASQFA